MGYYVIGKTTTLQHFKAVETQLRTKLKTDFLKKKKDAETIENFLKELKKLNLNHPVQRAIIDRVNNITGKKLSALFQNQGGDTFEEEMAVLLQALFEESGFADKVADSLFDSKNFNLNSNIVLSQNIGIGTITGNLKGKVVNKEGKTLSSKKHSQLHSLLKTGSEINRFLSQEDDVSYKQLTSAGLKQTKSDIMLEEGRFF